MTTMIKELVLFVSLTVISAQTTTFTYITGYEPRSDVTNHSKIDLDQKDISTAVGNYDWATAKNVYENGGNSVKASGAIRTIQGFSTGRSETSKSAESYFEIMNNYWTAKGMTPYSWANDIITAALDGTAVGSAQFTFAPSNAVTGSNEFRAEAIKKATLYLSIFPYVIWEMQDAIDDCNKGDLSDNTGAVHAWDEAAAFYSGSLEGIYAGGINGVETLDHYYLQYALAEKRAGNFGTATGDAPLNNNEVCCFSQANANIMATLTSGKNELVVQQAGAEGDSKVVTCDDILQYKNAVVQQSVAVLMQGTLRYLYKTDAKVNGGSPSNKELGELWAFASGILPLVSNVDSDVGDKLYARAWNQDTTYTFADYKTMLESTYAGLGITCGDVGSLCDTSTASSSTTCTPYSNSATSWDTSSCSDSTSSSNDDSNDLPGYGIALIVILVITTLIGAILVLWMYNKGSYKAFDNTEGNAIIRESVPTEQV